MFASPKMSETPTSLRRHSSVVETFHPSKLRVLVVDDDRVSLMLAAKMLRQSGYDVLTAENGETAFKQLETANPPVDIVISDVYMPVLDGFGLITKVREHPKYSEVAVIMISGAQDLDVVVKCLRAGADDFIVKPARQEVMANVWQSLFRKRKEHDLVVRLEGEQRTRDELKGQISSLQDQMHEAVETPINVILRTINDLSRVSTLTPEVREALTAVVKSLNTSNLYRPVMQQKMSHTGPMDRTTRKWLESVLDVGHEDASVTGAPVSAEEPLSLIPAGDLEGTDTELLRRWDFDQWNYKEDMLLTLLHTMFTDFGLQERFGISDVKLRSYLVAVRNHYHANPYHNFRHAFDVTHGVYVFLTKGKAAEMLTPMDIFALLVAAISHDIDHTGTNNPFHVATCSKLALRYNDRSVLESHHASMCFRLMRQKDNDIAEGLSAAQFRDFRQTVLQCILATDLSLHMEFSGKFQAMLDTSFNKGSRDDRVLLCTLLLKAADVNNQCKPYPIAKSWSDMVLEEFFQQGDQEKRMGLQVSPYMDRQFKAQGRMSINFIDFIVAPYYSKLVALLPDMAEVLDHLSANKQVWLQLLTEEEALARAAQMAASPPAPGAGSAPTTPTNALSTAAQSLTPPPAK